MKKLLIIGAVAVAAASGIAGEVNLREWLTAKGVTATDCVTGVDYHSDYGPQKLFDGVTNSTDTSARWLGGESSVANASVTIEIPGPASLFANVKLILRRIRLWRNLDASGVQRAPTTWAIWGSNNGTDWAEIQRQSAAVTWSGSVTNYEVALPDNVEQYRFIKFQPLTTASSYVWKVGLQEIEYFVEEIGKVVNLREWLKNKGVTVADCVSGAGHHADYGPANLFDGVNAVTTYEAARANRWLVNEAVGGTPTAYATIAAPDSLFNDDMGGLVLRRYRIYRYSDLTGDNCSPLRAPVKWTIYGSNDGTTWEVVHEQSEAANWREAGIRTLDYVEYEVPVSGRLPYRQFKFMPTQSFAEFYNSVSFTWQHAAMELEYFVEEAAPAVNLRDYLENKGETVASCVSGTGYHSSYGPEKLFDGEGMDGQSVASHRWLAGEADMTAASATIEIPLSAMPSGKKGLALKKIRLWRNINVYGNDGIERAPKTWVISGSNDGTNWTELQRQSEPVSWWDSSVISHDVLVPDNCVPYRFLKFQPLSSDYGGGWKAGLHELEYFVSEVPFDTVIVHGSLGDDVGDTSCGYGSVAGLSSGDSLTITAISPSCANGVKYEATGYTLETSTDGGITWGAATSYSGTSATIAYDGTPTRITWLWSPIAYKLNAHADEGNETVTVSPASADGYYAAGTSITVTAAGATSPTVTTFREWDVVPDGAVANGATVTFTMPAAPAEVNASFTRPWTYIAQGDIAGYPKYSLWAAVTDGNWLFNVSSRAGDAVSDSRYFNLYAYVKGSGRLDLTTSYTDLASEGTILYPLRGIRERAMRQVADVNHAWNDGSDKVTSVIVPADILDVEGNAFQACSNLTSVALSGTLEKYNVLSGGTMGAFRDCPALANATLSGATVLPHHIFAGSAPEVIFDGNPPATVGTGWASDWSLAVGCPRKNISAWRSDARFTALANIADVASKPNYATMVERYGQDLIGAWDNKWLFRYGEPKGTIFILR